MKKLLFISLLLPFFCFGQNLVPNPSFEDTVQCPGWLSTVSDCQGWSSYGESSDYFNSCATYNAYDVPSNGWGYQYAATGSAYCGMWSYQTIGSNLREFIGRQLASPLTVGQKYYVSMKVSMSDLTNCAINNFGIKFLNIPYDMFNPAPISNNAEVYTAAVIADTDSWVPIQGSFVSDSAYQYIVIGNLFDDVSTDTMIVDNTPLVCGHCAYYYVDDICVSPDSLTCMGEIGINEPKVIEQISIYPNPTTGKFTVQGAKGEIEVYDLFGRLVLRTNKPEIDMSGYPASIYMIKVGEAVRKLIKQ